MNPSKRLFDKCGGYRKLHSFTFATLIHLGTIKFCKRFIPWQEDPLGKIAGQMIGAARSGRQNIIEGSERSATSKETEIKLTDVARASLAELLGDYEMHLATKGVIPWSCNDPQHEKLSGVWLPEFEYTQDTMHDYWLYFQRIKREFDLWLESEDETIVANAMIVLIFRTMSMLSRQTAQQGESFAKAGGFRERMTAVRLDEREKQRDESGTPVCTECGKPMRKRTARSGPNAGQPFWGCSGYPDCKAILPIKED
ncbi:MAG: four helix bundle suffix domain-containing protein [Kiritimatiellae bacterium]|jgi:restriction system protein|nr:four helix bundle suffix domain-containing protein [Kiritimatiellia bacterium]